MIRKFVTSVALTTLWMAPAMAQTAYPNKEIILTVSYAPGGVTDIVGRVVARRLEKELGQSVVVVNRAGAQGTLGQDQVRRSKPDGYNLAIVSSSSTSLSPYLVKDVYKPTDFDYMGGVGVLRFGLAVSASAPYKTVQEFVEASKKQPLFYGSSSAVTSMAFGELSKKSGGRFEAVNYKSGPEIVTALIGGQVAALMQAPSEVLPHVESGRMRMLASVGPSRWPSNPDMPTLRDAGYDVAVESLIGVAAPKGMPAEVVKKLQTALSKIAADPGTAKELDAVGVESMPMSGAQFGEKMQAAFMAAEPIMRAQAAAAK